MFIGEVSKKTQLSIKAIRFYEQRGLIPPAKRQGAYRTYNEEDVELLKLIAEAKAMGIKLSDLQGVIRIQDGVVNWREIQQFLIEMKQKFAMELALISQRIARLDTCIHSIDSCPNKP